VLSLTALSCLFYTFFIFDILGDDVGFYRAYWVLVVMPLVPVVLVAANNLFMDYLKRRETNTSSCWASSTVSAADDKPLNMSSTSSYETSTVNSGRSTFRVQQINSVTLEMRNTLHFSNDWGREGPDPNRMHGFPPFQMNPLQQSQATNRPSDSVTLNRPSVSFALDEDHYPQRTW
jgi:hypothetical protein